MLVKVKALPKDRPGVLAIADIFRADIIDVDVDSVIIELTGPKPKIESLLKLLSEFEILEVARTGVAGLARGTAGVVYL